MKNIELRKQYYYEEVYEAVKKDNRNLFRKLFLKLHTKDQLDLFQELYPEKKRKIEKMLLPEEFAAVFEWMEPSEQHETFHFFSAEYAAKILLNMAQDNAASFLEDLEQKERDLLLSQLQEEDRDTLKELLSYEAESAGSIMTKEFLAFSPTDTTKEVIAQVRHHANQAEIIYYLYVVDKNNKLIGVLSLRDLILAQEEDTIGSLMFTQVAFARLDDDQEKVARQIQDYDLLAIPIIDEYDVLQGIVTVDDVMDILEEEVTEDFQEFSAISKSEEPSEKIWDIARSRIPWIVILLFMGMISASLISSFEETLSQVVVLAAFIPIIMDSAGNVGTQSLAVAVRKITLKDEADSIGNTLLVELIVGTIMGIISGTVLLITVLVLYQNMVLGLILGTTLLITLSISTVVGAFIPFLINKMKFDPAIASGPFITTINDILGLYIYFTIASLFLHLI
ncbi:magnesium transporter [Jeotgalibaca ciconiae]|uniref:Magnesium transporter MgtE n=1 Tax=Jeotgalibaca ciconiae TaxID=2496265 RepID=A0A3Q9BKH0_9LACT|nr:magnesium transporter [Jeotgalibaca ciconiae]AZP03339.1 magnesium transporter [Jeotgalibaca ciconiae]HJB23656.1 magnesium transporter [Candidatus Jeotgalibaca pullicola]